MNKFVIESFGCQMNKYDSELVAGILKSAGYEAVDDIEMADIVLINTCSVREHAERRVLDKIDSYYTAKRKSPHTIIGVLGCMAERLGPKLLEMSPAVSFALGPDAYRNLPNVLELHRSGRPHTDIRIDTNTETYTDIYPSRCKGISAWIAIMRGCNNFCSYCIVPYLRGRERSRPVDDILDETRKIVNEGFKEIVLLGQNVNSYRYGDVDFPRLIERVSQIDGAERIRFATSHPKDLSPDLLRIIAGNEKICSHIHLAVQSGSNAILKAMNRNYTREHFISLITRAREIIGDPGIYTDIIVGYPGESEQDFEDTIDLVEQLRFDGVFCFKYSPREGTKAYELKDDISEEDKATRLIRLNALQKQIAFERNSKLIGSMQRILVEGPDKKRKAGHFMGRTDTNKIAIFRHKNQVSVGDMVDIRINEVSGMTLFGELI
ncbi:tRNA (N6-isopentenyl adenosine(37)-C2)-methylthiotransferase MiaB [candidate division KSB1 bacterium]|nr:tRNA (N6-isopentenyl adenosine(37)-C2)-methylthiotransferase MiaB [candidate division KSB1 bacterium]